MHAPINQQPGSNVGAYNEVGEGGDRLSLTLIVAALQKQRAGTGG